MFFFNAWKDNYLITYEYVHNEGNHREVIYWIKYLQCLKNIGGNRIFQEIFYDKKMKSQKKYSQCMRIQKLLKRISEV